MLREKPKAGPYLGAKTPDNRIDPTPATTDRNEIRQMPSRNEADYKGKELAMKKGGKVTKVTPVSKAKVAPKPARRK